MNLSYLGSAFNAEFAEILKSFQFINFHENA